MVVLLIDRFEGTQIPVDDTEIPLTIIKRWLSRELNVQISEDKTRVIFYGPRPRLQLVEPDNACLHANL